MEANNKAVAVTLTPIVEREEDQSVRKNISVDYELSRQNIHGILKNGETALDELLQIARQSTHPRAYEVLAGFIKTLTETNKDLLNLSKQYKEMLHQDNPQKVTNNLYVGTGAELLALLNKDEDEDETNNG